MICSGTWPARGPLVAAASRASRMRPGSSSSSHRAGRSRTVTPRTPSSVTMALPGGSSAPSTTMRMWGSTGCPPRPNRGRSRTSAGNSRSRSDTEVVTMREGPTPSRSRGEWLCGSHLTHSQCGRASSPATTATRSWSGACWATAAATMARARPRVGDSSPATSTREKKVRDSAAGRSGWTRWVVSSRCRAEADTGSSWAMGGVSGASSEMHSGWLVRPNGVPAVAPWSPTPKRPS